MWTIYWLISEKFDNKKRDRRILHLKWNKQRKNETDSQKTFVHSFLFVVWYTYGDNAAILLVFTYLYTNDAVPLFLGIPWPSEFPFKVNRVPFTLIG